MPDPTQGDPQGPVAIGADLEPGTFHPPALESLLRQRLVPPRTLDGALLERFTDGGLDRGEWADAARWNEGNPASELRFSYALDASHRAIALAALDAMPELDCLAVYLRGVDILGHSALWASPEMRNGTVSR